MKAKEYLLEKGRIQAITRGRMSNDNVAFLKSEYDKGVRFTDWPKGEIKVSSKDTGAQVRVERVEEPDPVYTPPRFDEREYKAYLYYDGAKEEVSMRQVCATCNLSLAYHICQTPMVRWMAGKRVKIFGSPQAVWIERR